MFLRGSRFPRFPLLPLRFFLAAVSVAAFAALASPPVLADEPLPPPDFGAVVKEMTAEGTVAGQLGTFTMKLSVASLRKGWQPVRLFPTDVSLTDFRIKVGDDDFVHLLRKADGVDLLLGKEGNYSFEISFVCRVKEDKAGRSMTLPFAGAVRSLIQFTVPEKDLKVTTNPATNFGASEKDGKTEIVVYGGATSQVTVSWQSKAPGKEIASLLFAEQRALLTFSRGILRIDATYDFNIVQGSVNEFKLEVGEGLNLLGVTGPELRSWNTVEEGGRKILKISLLTDVQKDYQLKLQFERNLEQIPLTTKVPRVAALGIEREKGFLAIAAKKGIKVEVAEAKDISQIDVQELPKDLSTPDEMQLGFKYLKRPFEVALSVSEVTPKVTADVFTLARLSKDNLRLSTVVCFKIRDAGVFHFRIKLEEGLKLLDLGGRDINTQQVKDNILSVDLRSKAEGEYRLTLETEKGIKETDKAGVPPVEVLDVEREWGFVALTTVPGVKVEAKEIEGIRQINVRELPWQNFRPEGSPQAPAGGKGQAPAQSQAEQSYQAPVPGSEPVELAFRYLKHPFKLVVAVSDIMPEVSAEVRSEYKLTEKDIEMVSEVAYDIQKAGVFYLKVKLAPELRILSVDGPNIDDWKRDEKDGLLTVTLRSKTEGAYVLSLKTEMPAKDVTKGVAIPSLSVLDVKKERGYVTIQADPALRLKTDPKATQKLNEIDVKDLPPQMAPRAANYAIAYKYFEQPWTLGLSVEKVKPRVTVETFAFVSIGEQLVNASCTLRFSILYAGVSQFKVKLPPGVNEPDIEGDAIKHKGKEKFEDGDVWTITLHSPRTGTYDLFLTFQREVKEKSGAVAYVGPQVLKLEEAFDLERETGYIALAARPDVEMASPEVKNLTPIDEKEIPREFKRGITVPLLMGFRYLEHPYRFSVNIKQNEFGKVLVAVVEALRFSTTITEEGNMITDLLARIRNTREPYLTLELPEDAEIWSLFVAGVQETPYQAEEGGKRLTKIPIMKAGRGDETFDVRLRYGRKLKPLGALGTIDLACPTMNIPTLRLGWALSLPERYELVTDAGNMRRVYGFEPTLANADPDQPFTPVAATGQEPNAPPAPGVGPVEDRQVARNKRAQQQMADARLAQGEMAVKGGRASGLPSMYTGERPGSGGRTYLFQTLISLDEPGRIRSRYVKESVGYTSKGLLVLLVLGLGFYLYQKRVLSESARMSLMAAAAIFFLGVQTLLEQSYLEYLTVIVLASAGCFAVYFVLWIGGMVQSEVKRQKEEREKKEDQERKSAKVDILPYRPSEPVAAAPAVAPPPAPASPAPPPPAPAAPAKPVAPAPPVPPAAGPTPDAAGPKPPPNGPADPPKGGGLGPKDRPKQPPPPPHGEGKR